MCYSVVLGRSMPSVCHTILYVFCIIVSCALHMQQFPTVKLLYTTDTAGITQLNYAASTYCTIAHTENIDKT